MFLTTNFITLMILLALTVILIVNHKSEIPGTRYFYVGIILLFTMVIAEVFAAWSGPDSPTAAMLDPVVRHRVQVVSSWVTYVFSPFIILIEVFITFPGKKYRAVCSIPAIINCLVYSTALFGSDLAFYFSPAGRWGRGLLGMTIYFVLLFYVLLLTVFSITYFRAHNRKKGGILMLIIMQSILAAFLEYTNILSGYVNAVIALCMLEYYFYLSVIYQQELRETIAEKELNLTRQRITLLLGQIRPHFIFNTLSIIRSLAKKDSAMAVSCIDSFSDYLKAHIQTLQNDKTIPFMEELENVKAYLDLGKAGSLHPVDVCYDLQYTDFKLPPLSLEPLAENAIKHGIDVSGRVMTIRTFHENNEAVIVVENRCRPAEGLTDRESERLGVGIENTRKRLELLCSGTLDLQITDENAVATVRIPDGEGADQSPWPSL